MSTLKERAIEARERAAVKTNTPGLKRAPWARMLGIEPSAIYQIEGGKTQELKAKTAASMAKFSGLRGDWIREGKPPKFATDLADESQPARFDDETMTQAVELLYLMADARPDDQRFHRLTWSMIQVAAKVLARHGERSNREIVADLLVELGKG